MGANFNKGRKFTRTYLSFSYLCVLIFELKSMKNSVPDRMKAVCVRPEDGSLSTRTVDIPVPGRGEVLIRMLAAPVNPSDLAKVRELRPEDAGGFIPGTEGCGIVVKAGAGLLPFLYLGKRVACSSHRTDSGSWAEYMVTTAGSCFPAGKKLSDEQAAMSIVNPMTALALLDMARKGNHRTVINTAANGALGKLIARVFSRKGIRVMHVVRTAPARQEMEAMGCSDILVSSEEGFEQRLGEWCRQTGCTMMLDAVGGGLVNRVLDVLPDFSTILLYGNLSQEKIQFIPPQLVRKNKRIEGFVLSHWIRKNGMFKALRNLVKAGRMIRKGAETRVQGVFPLDSAQQAVEVYQADMGAGKVLLKLTI